MKRWDRIVTQVIYWMCFLVALPIYPLFWLSCRLTAARCPKCGSKWKTELMGEWAHVEDWQCHSCNHWWFVRY